MQDRMKAVQVGRIGGPEGLIEAQVSRPEPAAGEALVRIAYAGVNYVDVMQRTDFWRHAGDPEPELPFGLGVEASGVVTALGEGTTDVAVGDRVGLIGHALNTYAEYTVVPAQELIPLPDDVDDRTAAASLASGLLSQVLLHEHGPISGRAVAISGSSGVIGSVLVQWASALGAHVIATATSPDKAALAQKLGAAEIVDAHDAGLADLIRTANGGRGVDLVLDAVGGDLFQPLLDALDTGGTIIPFGIAGGKQPPLEILSLIDRSRRVAGIMLFDFLRTRAERIERAEALFNALRAGHVSPVIDSIHPLANAAAAHRRFESAECFGKVLIQVGQAE
jgi:NADPH:quinone reductase